MRIVLNGDPLDLPGPLSIQALLEHLGIDYRIVAVERNRVVIKRARYADTLIADGDEVEIVAFVGGGSTGSPETTPCPHNFVGDSPPRSS